MHARLDLPGGARDRGELALGLGARRPDALLRIPTAALDPRHQLAGLLHQAALGRGDPAVALLACELQLLAPVTPCQPGLRLGNALLGAPADLLRLCPEASDLLVDAARERRTCLLQLAVEVLRDRLTGSLSDSRVILIRG